MISLAVFFKFVLYRYASPAALCHQSKLGEPTKPTVQFILSLSTRMIMSDQKVSTARWNALLFISTPIFYIPMFQNEVFHDFHAVF